MIGRIVYVGFPRRAGRAEPIRRDPLLQRGVSGLKLVIGPGVDRTAAVPPGSVSARTSPRAAPRLASIRRGEP